MASPNNSDGDSYSSNLIQNQIPVLPNHQTPSSNALIDSPIPSLLQNPNPLLLQNQEPTSSSATVVPYPNQELSSSSSCTKILKRTQDETTSSSCLPEPKKIRNEPIPSLLQNPNPLLLQYQELTSSSAAAVPNPIQEPSSSSSYPQPEGIPNPNGEPIKVNQTLQDHGPCVLNTHTELPEISAVDDGSRWSAYRLPHRFPCSFCIERFDSALGLETHLRDFHNKEYPCRLCLARFPDEPSLTLHYQMAHGQNQD